MSSKSSLILKRKIAVGGMGEVFEAFLEDEFGARYHVAAKKLKAPADDRSSNLAAFKKELEISSKLSHPNVIRVLSCVEHEGDLYMISEFLEGLTLSDVLKDQQPLSLSEKLLISISILEAALYAHNYKDPASLAVNAIVHRDISPQNVMLSIYGEVKLIDFGLASVEGLDSKESGSSNDIAGKLGYLAPEVLEGASVDSNSDAYSVGVLLYYIFSGVHPFERSLSVETLQLIQSKSQPDLGELISEISVESIDLINDLISGDSKSRANRLNPLLQSLKTQAFGDIGSKDALAGRVRSALLEIRGDVLPERTLTEKDFAKASNTLRKKNRRRIVLISALVTALIVGAFDYFYFFSNWIVEKEDLEVFAFKKSIQIENARGRMQLLSDSSPESIDQIKKFFPDESTCWIFCSGFRSAAGLIYDHAGLVKVANQSNGSTGVHVYNSVLEPFLNFDHDLTNTFLLSACTHHDLTKSLCALASLENSTIVEKFQAIFPMATGNDLKEEAAIFTAAAINARLARGRIDESKLENLEPLSILDKSEFSRVIMGQAEKDFFVFRFDRLDLAARSDYDCLRLASSLMALELTEKILAFTPILEKRVELLLIPKTIDFESQDGELYRFKVQNEVRETTHGVCRYVLTPTGDAFAKLYEVSF